MITRNACNYLPLGIAGIIIIMQKITGFGSRSVLFHLNTFDYLHEIMAFRLTFSELHAPVTDIGDDGSSI